MKVVKIVKVGSGSPRFAERAEEAEDSSGTPSLLNMLKKAPANRVNVVKIARKDCGEGLR